jgi:hypothetical protein
MNLQELQDFIKGLPAGLIPEVKITILVDVMEGEDGGAPGPTPDPTPTPTPNPTPTPTPEVEYKVSVTDKANQRAKVRPTANMSIGEIDYVYTGDVVYGPGKEVNGFTYITRRDGEPVLTGFVESQYIIK